MEAAKVSPRRYGGKSAEQRRAERRAQLVEAALEIWQEQGWAAVTMRGVCAQAGLTDRYFYESFTDRDALLGTVWDQMRDETLDMLTSVIASASDEGALDQLRAVLDAVVHHIADEPARAQIIFGDHAGSAVLEQRRRDTVQMATDLMIGLARPFLREGVDEQALRINTLLGIGGFIELMLAWRSGLVESTTDEVVAHLADVGAALGSRFLRS
ncbi:TetR/AcrR family transcriptional regulator [Nocardioides immobilis]|uniref:TetR/AcrR family transcriptional regulator n=1 Tax=Nocardioides immobilis TaxID=2049295 RepID=A0A417XVX8_9ACTN|nr:TetR/AcrR family transcriptional regulator [Nocardioides immobilis]RHW24648.1 TetR/AcrR family transcriptional regulator [Nocardioides immobilis]